MKDWLDVFRSDFIRGNIGIDGIALLVIGINIGRNTIFDVPSIFFIYHWQLKIRFSYFDDPKIIGHQCA
jgi:hypothetical protein